MTSALDQLKQHTVVVADTGEFDIVAEYKPQDATTNPSLIYKAVQLKQYSHLLNKAVTYAKLLTTKKEEQVEIALDKLFVLFGVEILKLIKGRVSTELDARLSYDTEATIARARKIAKLYEEEGVNWKSRVLFKIASTWEGIRAAEKLEREGYHCNLTLLFSFSQAVACADAKVTLISPFVGRIRDYWMNELHTDWDTNPAEDPGVLSVRQIYNYYKKFDYKTIVMGASFRNVGEIMELAGVDYLTISPNLLKELAESDIEVDAKLTVEAAKKDASIEKINVDEKTFRWMMCNDPMATVKLAEGIRGFSKDINSLEGFITKQLTSK